MGTGGERWLRREARVGHIGLLIETFATLSSVTTYLLVWNSYVNNSRRVFLRNSGWMMRPPSLRERRTLPKIYA